MKNESATSTLPLPFCWLQSRYLADWFGVRSQRMCGTETSFEGFICGAVFCCYTFEHLTYQGCWRCTTCSICFQPMAFCEL